MRSIFVKSALRSRTITVNFTSSEDPDVAHIMTTQEMATYLKLYEIIITKYSSVEKISAIRVGSVCRFDGDVINSCTEMCTKTVGGACKSLPNSIAEHKSAATLPYPNVSGTGVFWITSIILFAIVCLFLPIQGSLAKEVGKIVWPALSGGLIVGGPYHGSALPGKDGGVVVGGPLNGSAWPDSAGGIIVGGPLNGTAWPSAEGGIIVGGPLNGTFWPPATGGIVVGGPLNGYLILP